MLKIVLGLISFAGFILVLGVAGADCDGKCMENSMPFSEILFWSVIGLSAMAAGVFGILKLEEQ